MSQATAIGNPVPDLHRSARRQAIAEHNEGFLEGVCHAIDTLRALGRHEAADALERALFRKAAAQ